MDRVTFTKSVTCIFGFTEQFLCVARDDLNHILVEGFGSKPLKSTWNILRGMGVYHSSDRRCNLYAAILDFSRRAYCERGKVPLLYLH